MWEALFEVFFGYRPHLAVDCGRYAMPVLVIALTISWYFISKTEPLSPDQLLASVSEDALVEYLQDTDMNTEDFLEILDYNLINADSLNLQEASIIPFDENLEYLLDEFNTEL